VEIATAVVVGYFVIWMIEAQAREKVLHQETISRLSAINAVTGIVSQSLTLEHTLNAALDKVLEAIGVEAGMVFRLDKRSQELVLAARRGVSEGSATELDRLSLGESPCGRVAQSGELMVIQDPSQDPPAMRREGLRMQVAVPLKSTDRVQGVLAVATRRSRQFLPEELELLAAIGNEIGVAIENARLYESMRFYVQEITRAQEDERQRIARELHDETIQMLIVLSRRLEALITPSEPMSETTRQRLRSLQELIRNTSGGIRRFVRELRPPTLDHLGLVATIEGLTRDLAEKDELEAELRATGDVRRLTSEEELVLFRIAQEALSNVRRHSAASQVIVRLGFYPDKVLMAVDDNGRGFHVPERMDDLVSMGRLGLIGMQERARTLGGTLTIQSEPGRGTVVTVDVPIQSRSEKTGSSAQENRF
jgi:signal transduction histidine kinase